MVLTRWSVCIFALIVLAFPSFSQEVAQGQDAESGTLASIQIPAVASFTGEEFTVQRRLLRRQSRHEVIEFRFPSPVRTAVTENNVVPAEYYRPLNVGPGQAPRPAVVCLHILNGNFELVRLMCSVLADHGIPAMMFKLPYYGERSPPGGRKALLHDAELFSEALEQAMSDIRRSVDVLTTLPEVDGGKVGICGISLGAILGATACDREPRLARAMLILGGGALKDILMTAREAREIRQYLASLPDAKRAAILKRMDSLDPLNNAARLKKLAARDAVLMINAADDHVVPRECTEKLAETIGIADDVVWLEGLGHYTAMASLPRMLNMAVEFFGTDLPPGDWAPAPAEGSATPAAVLAAILQDVVTVLGGPVDKGHCHVLDADITMKGRGAAAFNGRVRFMRGSDGRFVLDCPVPEVGWVLAGQGDTAWLSGGKGTVFVGVEDAVAGRTPALFFNMQHLLKVRVAMGAVAGIAAAPDVFSQYLSVERREGDVPALVVTSHHKQARGQGVVELAADGRIPRRILLGTDGQMGEITVRQWLVNSVAPDALFDPPPELARQNVRQEDVCRMIAAMFDFGMEKL